jgi:chromate reductase, NAD(P)H dehydrogenase (quinone)
MPDSKLDVLAISGSLRKGSFNTALLRTAQEEAPADVGIEIYDHSDMPLYNGDVEAAAYPAAATRLKERILKADAILFAVPEYNYSFSGVLKNAIDWASRPYGKSAWAGKPAALMSTGGGLGASRAQYHLRQVLNSQGMHILHAPEIFVANAATKFDDTGRLTDDAARGLIKQAVGNLAAWTRRLAASA